MHRQETASRRRDLYLKACAAALAVALLGGCSGWEEIDYHDTSDIPQGSGLISGDKGGWTIFRVEERRRKPKTEETAEGEKQAQQ